MLRVFSFANFLGRIVSLFALTLLLPLGISLWLDDGASTAYDKAIFITLAIGVITWLLARNIKSELKTRDGFLLVILVWVLLPAFATLPLLLYLPELSFIDAYFETVSGLTTTGATILTGLDSLPVSINVWRAELIWLGGMGLIVLAVAVLPLLGIGGREMFQAETPGPMKESKITPRITETAKGLWLVYFAITVACFFSFKIAGMTWLDALIHSFCTMGLGGFSSHDASFAYFNSVAIETVAVVFMLIAGMNFATHFLGWRRRSFSAYRHDAEIKYFLLITLASCVGIAFYLWWSDVYLSFFAALRAAVFNTVSIATTTGFASVDYNTWPIFAPLWMLFLSTFVTCAGSTGGGIKMIRAQLLTKQVFREFSKTLHPQAVISVKSSRSVVPNKIVQAVLVFVVIYIISVIALTLILTISGLSFITSFSATIACINNAGPGLHDVGPATAYAGLDPFQKLVCVFAMLLGRLELFTLLVVFTRAYWRK